MAATTMLCLVAMLAAAPWPAHSLRPLGVWTVPGADAGTDADRADAAEAAPSHSQAAFTVSPTYQRVHDIAAYSVRRLLHNRAGRAPTPTSLSRALHTQWSRNTARFLPHECMCGAVCGFLHPFTTVVAVRPPCGRTVAPWEGVGR